MTNENSLEQRVRKLEKDSHFARSRILALHELVLILVAVYGVLLVAAVLKPSSEPASEYSTHRGALASSQLRIYGCAGLTPFSFLRMEYPGAIYHLMNRGDRREAIFRDDQD
jgi:hypothetical protein